MTTMLEHAAAAVAVAEQEAWLFTFGADHRLMITNAYTGRCDGAGVSLYNRYVRLSGTWDEARARFIALFGSSFCDQYTLETGLAMAAEHGLRELELFADEAATRAS